ncbi:unnamed protein product [Durusdinium trenchii]|uniref:Uncharacterized protein n=2 Tax=Durusdinium trenchii TaxID=1381693 RepID=A0ABP0N8E6_9DINO
MFEQEVEQHLEKLAKAEQEKDTKSVRRRLNFCEKLIPPPDETSEEEEEEEEEEKEKEHEKKEDVCEDDEEADDKSTDAGLSSEAESTDLDDDDCSSAAPDEAEEDESPSEDEEESSEESEESEEESSPKAKKGGGKDEKSEQVKGILKVSQKADNMSTTAKANSVTHKSQWDQFNRQMLDRKKFPASLASHVLKNKNDVFNEWLAAKGCWEDVAIKFERKVSEIKEFKKSRGGLKKRDILLKYPKEKAEDLVRRLRSKGMWEWDEDFPNDEEEIFYYCGTGGELSKKTKVEESQGAVIKDKTRECFDIMTQEGAPLAAGVLPAIGNASPEGEKAINEALNGETTKVKNQPKPKKEEAEKVKPTTPKETAIASLPDILKSATDARKHALALKHLNYAGELVSGLMGFSTKMEKIYEKIKEIQDSEDEHRFKKFNSSVEEQQSWYKQAEARLWWLGPCANDDKCSPKNSYTYSD